MSLGVPENPIEKLPDFSAEYVQQNYANNNLQNLVTSVLFMYHDYLIFAFYLFHVFSYVQIFVHFPAYDADNQNEYYRIYKYGG